MLNNCDVISACKGCEPGAAAYQPQFLAPVLLVEIAAAVALVVGLFLTASQPLTWTNALRFAMCCAVAVLLWMTDTHLNAGQDSTADTDEHGTFRETAREVS